MRLAGKYPASLDPMPSPLESLDATLGRIRRLWDQPAVRAWFGSRLGPEPVDAAVFRTLGAVNQLGPDGASVNGVADFLRVDGSTASRFLDRACEAGLVTSAPHRLDRRRRSFSLTDEGRERLRTLRNLRLGLLDRLTAGWSGDDIETLIGLLDRLDSAVLVLGVEEDD